VALAAARAAYDDEGRATVADTAARPTPQPRWHWSPRTVRVVGAAAVGLALAALVPLLGRLGDDDDAQATRFEETGAAIGGAAEDAATPEALTSTTAGGADAGAFLVDDLGSFDDVEALLAALAAPDATSYRSAAPNVTASAGDRGACPAPVRAAGQTTRWLNASVDGEPVLVVVVVREDGPTTVTVYRRADCERLGGGTLP
jgi:hypothetical protein